MNVIAFIIGIIMILGVGIPVATQVITSANLTGISATIVSFIPVFIVSLGIFLKTNTVGSGGISSSSKNRWIRRINTS